jgi:hypothetical protein
MNQAQRVLASKRHLSQHSIAKHQKLGIRGQVLCSVQFFLSPRETYRCCMGYQFSMIPARVRMVASDPFLLNWG